MSPRLASLVERARNHVPTPEEVREASISFAWGNLNAWTDRCTREGFEGTVRGLEMAEKEAKNP